MVRSPFMMVLVSALLMFLIALSRRPMFRLDSGSELMQTLNSEPLAMRQFPELLGRTVEGSLLERIRDHWGFVYPPSASPEIQDSGLAAAVRNLELGLQQLGEERPTRSFRYLDRAYSQYMRKVTGDRDDLEDADPIPGDEDGMVLYGLFRYNRAYALMETAGSLRRGDADRETHMRRAIYDLRRTIHAFESLGRTAYWGRDIHAWEGSSLLPMHGNFPIHHAYANLTTAYLRIGDQPDYPEVEPGYLQGQGRKYALGSSALSPVVSLLNQSCEKDRRQGRAIDIVKFRLTLGLQNLEAAARGMLGGNEARYNYMIGIILRSLREVTGVVTPDDVIGFLSLAASAPQKGDHFHPVLAAQKELALMYLELGNGERFLECLARVDPSALRDALGGPDKDYGLLFTDIAQWHALRGGELEAVLNHLEFRAHELEAGNAEQDVRQAHGAIVAGLGRVFFTDLKQRLMAMIRAGETDRVGRWLHLLDGDRRLAASPLHPAYQTYCREPLEDVASVTASRWLYRHPHLYPWIGFSTYLFALLLPFYWLWCYRSHVREARKVLWLGYQEDLENR